jgi:hypothetical protein
MAPTIAADIPSRRTRSTLRTPRQVLRDTEAVGPGLLVGLLLALLVGGGLRAYHGDPLAFVRFGRDFVGLIHPPRGAVVYSDAGNDGQYFWSLAQDPLLRNHDTLQAFATQSFRLQRIAYPALAYLLAAGRSAATGWTLLGLNVAIVLLATVLFALYARRRGWSGWWALGVGLLPGLQYAVLGDLSDALAVTTMLGGLIAWRHRRHRAAAALLTVACLAREPMMLAVLAIGIETTLDVRRRVHQPGGSLRRAVREGSWTPLLVPVAAFCAWQLYIHARVGVSTSAPWTAFAAPFTQVVAELRHALQNATPIDGAWDLLYLTGMLAGIGLAIAHARRGRSATALAALLFALVLPVLTFGYAWSYTRLSAPLFACLLLLGLERRSRGTLALCGAIAILGALVPLSIG